MITVGPTPQRETRFTVNELQSQLAEIERAIVSFYELRKRWHFSQS